MLKQYDTVEVTLPARYPLAPDCARDIVSASSAAAGIDEFCLFSGDQVETRAPEPAAAAKLEIIPGERLAVESIQGTDARVERLRDRLSFIIPLENLRPW